MLHTNYHKKVHPSVTPGVTSLPENAIVTSFVASRRNYLIFKRIQDCILSVLFILFVLSWLLPLIAIWIKLDSRGPVFFVQKRVGRNGRIFRCIKLRTMVANEDADEKPAEEDDARVTRAGKFLRKTNLDELPQFLNVVKGDMSITGPRPHMPADCIRFSFVVTTYDFRNLVKPGITGLAQVKGFRGPTTDYQSIVDRYYWDAVYVRKASTWLDLKIIMKTMGRCSRNLAVVVINGFKKRKPATQ